LGLAKAEVLDGTTDRVGTEVVVDIECLVVRTALGLASRVLLVPLVILVGRPTDILDDLIGDITKDGFGREWYIEAMCDTV
jgi:hypothetical protein